MNVSSELRKAIADSGKSRYRLSRLSGVADSALSRFMSGERGLGLPAIDRLCKVLKLRLTTTKRKGR